MPLADIECAPTTAEEYLVITELAGDQISDEQLQRMVNRYSWAAGMAVDTDVLEVACGAGPGLNLLKSVAKSLTAGDYSEATLQYARNLQIPQVELREFDAQEMPFASEIFDLVIIFEALYYIPSAEKFFDEAVRILRPGGQLLIATANKDLYDFNPSPRSFEYLGVTELTEQMERRGLVCAFFGDTPIEHISLRQRILRPVKAMVVRLGLMPKTSRGKIWLKRLVFGRTRPMPASIGLDTLPYQAPTRIAKGEPDRRHKVIFCAAKKS